MQAKMAQNETPRCLVSAANRLHAFENYIREQTAAFFQSNNYFDLEVLRATLHHTPHGCEIVPSISHT